MKNIKKKYFCLGSAAGILSTAAIVVPVSIVYQSQSVSSENNQRKGTNINSPALSQKVNYKEVRNLLRTNDFDSSSTVNQKLAKFNLRKTEIPKGKELSPEVLNKVHEMQDKYLDHFEENNFSLSEIDNYLKTKFPQYASVSQETSTKYTNIKQDDAHHNFSLFYHRFVNFNATRDDLSPKLRESVRALSSLKTTLISVSAVAAVAAAGFWASAGWFGITIPWAVAATAIATVCGIGAHKISTAMSQDGIPDSNSSWSSSDLSLTDIKRILRSIGNVVRAVKFAVGATTEASSGACVAAKGVEIAISVAFEIFTDGLLGQIN